MEDVGVGSVLRVPFGPRRAARRRRRAGRVLRAADRSGWPSRSRRSRPAQPPSLSGSGLWVAREYCSTPSRGLQLVLPPGTGRRRPAGPAAGPSCRAITAAAEAALAGGGSSVPASGPSSRRSGRRAAAADARRRSRRQPRHGRPASSGAGLVSTRDSRVERRPGATGVGDAGAAVPSRPMSSGGRSTRSSPPSTGRPDSPARDPPAWGHRLRQDRGLPCRGRGGARAGAGGDRPGPRDRPHAAGGGPLPRPPRRPDRGPALGPHAGERYDEWLRLRRGEASVCVGPRSAVFAPVARPRPDRDRRGARPLLQAGGGPRLRRPHRRPPARAADCGAALVAGTATPRPGELAGAAADRAAAPGRRPPAAAGRGPRHARRRPPRRARCTPRPGRRSTRSAAAGEKAIVMVNRRGFAPWLTCRSCGHHWGCPNCDVSLIVHRDAGRLVCHHCAHSEPLPAACPDCGSTTLSRPARAPSSIEALLAERLDPMPVLRLDSDIAAGRGAHARILAAFGEADERGPGRHPDGRQGPRLPRGDPERDPRRRRDPALPRLPRRGADLRDGRPARRSQRPRRGRRQGDRPDPGPGAPRASPTPPEHDAAGFLGSELERRRALRYPPFSHLVRIVLRAEREARLDAGRDGGWRGACVERFPAGPSCSARRRCSGPGRHRRRLLIKADGPRGRPSPRCGDVVEGLAADRGLRDVAIGVDVDPQ